MALNRFGQHVPDILDSLAQLSNDEVPTPPTLANEMLDLLPAEVWINPTLTWLDPCSKSGVFLREVAARLLSGLAEWEPDYDKRRNHIFHNMLHGTSITELTGMMSRRSLYYSKDAASEHSVVHFRRPHGNLPFVYAQHDFGKNNSANLCTICGGPRDLERGAERENYAYSFIHGAFPTKELDMKFDVIVGNPPYQIDSDGNTRTKPVYQLFVQQAIKMDPRYVLMITPSRWFAGGLGLDDYRAQMLRDHRLSHFIDYPQSKDCFPGVKIRGGVSYFLWDRKHTEGCTVQTVRGTNLGVAMTRSLDAYDVFVRYNEGVRVLEKVGTYGDPKMKERVSSLVPFGLRAKFNDYVTPGTFGAVKLHIMGRKTQWVDRSAITVNEQWLGKYKTLLHAAYGEDHDGPFAVIASPFVGGPNSACTETYLVIDTFDSQEEAENLASYLRTKFCRFLIWLRMNTQHVSKDRFAFVPQLPMDRVWDDAALYKRYGLDETEINFIEWQIREMSGPAVAVSA
ncbi:restriction endonuclease [Rathayibacter festucae]|uniref:Restriction endonuclease n=1 Tax=Rathayibacter festucae TaxID=110937 RepID=A0ABX6H4C3_9MICO|nr:Eco57I restriction-modification methylase domain-containing protein [Rathayibacter festucae]QHC64505.1 restriction endonuclease [Rathayibacter festucae]